MAQSLANILVPLVFSTKNRDHLLFDETRDGLHSYMAGAFKGVDSPAILINSTTDHVHALFVLSKKTALSKVIEEVKTESSKWLKLQDPRLADFHWQAGYGAFSVSQSNRDRVIAYIANQAEHHRRKSFQDELRALCKRHNVPIDERYVWD